MAEPTVVLGAEKLWWPRRNIRWIVAGLLCAVTIINYVDRQTLSLVAPEMFKPIAAGGLGLTPEEYGLIGTVFLFAYVFGQVLGGILMDKVGTRIGFAIILTWWSVATIGHRFAGGVLAFAFWRAMLALGEAGNWPGAIKTISEWFPAKERGLATGIFNLGSSTGAIFAPPLIIAITIRFGWRSSFVLAGCIGFLWLIAWLWFYRIPRQHKFITDQERVYIESGQESAAVSERTEKLPWFRLLRYRQVWGILIPRFLSEPVWWFYLFWLPTYLVKARGFNLKDIVIFALLPYVTADLGCLFGGGMSTFLMKRGWTANRARKTIMVFSAFLMPAALFVVGAKSAWVAIALICLATFGHQSWSTNMLVLPADIFPQRVVASVTGIGGVGTIAGALFQTIVGYLVQHYSYGPVFVIAGVLHPLAAMMMLLLVGKIRRVEFE